MPREIQHAAYNQAPLSKTSLDLLGKFLAFVPGLEIRVFDKAIVYCVDIRVVTVALFFVRPSVVSIDVTYERQGRRRILDKDPEFDGR